jgi:hypothetical protein
MNHLVEIGDSVVAAIIVAVAAFLYRNLFGQQIEKNTRQWLGKINGSGRRDLTITAVVAPPTSQDFFRYYQVSGGLRVPPKWDPIPRVPLECSNRVSVQAEIS